MTADRIRAHARVGRDVTITFRPGDGRTSSRVAKVRGTVVDHTSDRVFLGVHPDLLAIPFERITGVTR